MRTNNPVLGQRFENMAQPLAGGKTMTINGTIDKAAILFFLVLISATFVWNRYLDQSLNVGGLMVFGAIGGFIAAMVTFFKPNIAPISAPVYAILEGLFLGGISAQFNYAYPGLPMQAVGLTFAVLAVMLGLYRFRIIKVTAKLRSGIISATLGVLGFYVINFFLGFMGMGFGLNNSPLGIGISLVIVGIAAFNLLLDFDFIENASRRGLPGYMNWIGALGLMVTLVWLYLEILRLLARTRD